MYGGDAPVRGTSDFFARQTPKSGGLVTLFGGEICPGWCPERFALFFDLASIRVGFPACPCPEVQVIPAGRSKIQDAPGRSPE